jgi:hypothetical protein
MIHRIVDHLEGKCAQGRVGCPQNYPQKEADAHKVKYKVIPFRRAQPSLQNGHLNALEAMRV